MKKIKVVISPFTFVFAVIWCFFGEIETFVVYFISIALHEFAHAYVAGKLGYACEKITMSPFGATLYAECDEFASKDELKIALAGPVFSLIIALLCVCVWWILPEIYNYTMDLCMANFAIFLLNILPVYPLDGGRVLSSKLSESLEPKKRAYFLNIISLIFACSLILLSVISVFYTFNYTFGVVGIMIICTIVSGGKENSYRRVLSLVVKSKKLNRGIRGGVVLVPQHMQLTKVFSLIDGNNYYKIVVVDENFNVKFSVYENDLMRILEKYSGSIQIGDVCIDKTASGW